MHDRASLLVPQVVATVFGRASYISDGHPANVEALDDIVGDSTQVRQSGATDFSEYPYACDSGWYGDQTGGGAQSSVVCSGQCPAGSFCPFPGTVQPERCPPGHHCPAESSSPLPVN